MPFIMTTIPASAYTQLRQKYTQGRNINTLPSYSSGPRIVPPALPHDTTPTSALGSSAASLDSTTLSQLIALAGGNYGTGGSGGGVSAATIPIASTTTSGGSSSSVGVIVVLGIIIAIGYFMFRKKKES